MGKILNFLLLVVAVGGIAAGGFALYKNLNSETKTSTTTTEAETNSNNNSQNPSYTEKVYNIGDDQRLAFTNSDYMSYNYSINTNERAKVLIVETKISKGNLSFDALKAGFKYLNDSDYNDYMTITYTVNSTNTTTIASFVVKYDNYHSNKIPSTVFVTLNSETNVFHPSFEIRTNENNIDGTSF